MLGHELTAGGLCFPMSRQGWAVALHHSLCPVFPCSGVHLQFWEWVAHTLPFPIPWCILLLKYQDVPPQNLLLLSPTHPLLLSSTAHSTQCSHTCITFPSPNPPERLSLLKQHLPSQDYSSFAALYCHFRSAKIWKQSTANWSNKGALIAAKLEQNIQHEIMG